MTVSAKGTVAVKIPTDPLLVAVGDKVTANAAKLDALTAKVDALAVTAAAILAKISTAAPPPPPPPAPADWPIATPVSGGVYSLTAGTKLASQHFDVPVTVKGAGMRATKIDGQGGVGAGFRLAWGKGVVHTSGAALRFEDVGFIRGGGGDSNSDGEAGFYAEGTGAGVLLRCSFDNCENGLYSPAGSATELTLDGCVFGRTNANGLNDGRSHDMYVGSQVVTIRRTIFAGNSRGNTIKMRGAGNLLIEDSHIRRSLGRWIDTPDFCRVVSNRNVYATIEVGHWGSNNAFGFNDENYSPDQPGFKGSFTSTDDTFYFARPTEAIWLGNWGQGSATAEFIRPKVFWVGPAGSVPPTVVISGVLGQPLTPGALIGANPFTAAAFSEANRVDAPPPLPGDPV